jgi:DNA-binding transcriptional ArsR family regulator
VSEEAPPPTDPLAPLLGRTRAGLLVALSTPSSTTRLAALTGASIGATGDHLKVLLDAGLVTRERIARSVLYRRTPLGDALAG